MKILAFIINTVLAIILLGLVSAFLHFLKIDRIMLNSIYYTFCAFYGWFFFGLPYKYIYEALNKYKTYKEEKFIKEIGENLTVKIGKNQGRGYAAKGN